METQLKLFPELKRPENYWTKYNKSQTREKTLFLTLLKDLCNTLENKKQADMIFCLAIKAYAQKSGRRVIGELELCRRSGYIDKIPHFNSLYNYLRNKDMTILLQELIKLSSLPLKAIEKKFACDSTGFGMSVLDDRWSRVRQSYSKHHRYLKAHISFGVLTNIVTSCRITEGTQNDSPMLPEMVDETAENFSLEEWSADKAYLSKSNLQEIDKHGCLPFIPFKSNTRSRRRKGSAVWTEMYQFFKENNELFMKKYHLRSNAESGMMMIKARFGDLTNMRSGLGSKNDVLCKILCHNLCVLCQEIFLLGIDFNFAQVSKDQSQ